MTIIDMGEGYYLSGTRVRVGSFNIVAIDWEHPNYGYFTDAMLWYRSAHSIYWIPIPIANWTNKYDEISDFLADFPQLKHLFDTDFYS